ncbi:hypothetical protein [Deinococcus humi]|uniref:Uncharacterized protein n=1 Tax=Deinococcus humi TaxID=662880 RepID=A0A7W8K1V2_9DEIO|nr:hypothetical protein [Deinococcus humi]MBB5365739.1 hypothetical protein [Deinococcus humi]GGO38396.1 hypothetical protein GCM10008949_44850 [Deinococcus humi]
MNQPAPFDRQEFARLVYIQLIDAQPRLLLRRGKQVQAITVQHVLKSYPEQRPQVFEVLRAMLPFGCEITETGALRRIPSPSQLASAKKSRKTKNAKNKAQQPVTKNSKAPKKTVQMAHRKTRKTSSGGRVRSDAYEWKGPADPLPATDPGLADRIRASMSAYAASTKDTQQTSAWDRPDIGYWD